MIIDEFVDELVTKLEKSHNIILHGAPGTGTTYLARQVAAQIIGCSLEELADSSQFKFVQFHPSYDYTYFVEGYKPSVDCNSGNMVFKLQDGVFKEFVKNVSTNTSDRTHNKTENKLGLNEWKNYWLEFDDEHMGYIESIDEKQQLVTVVSYEKEQLSSPTESVKIEKLLELINSDCEYSRVADLKGIVGNSQRDIDSYYFVMYQRLREVDTNSIARVCETLKNTREKLEMTNGGKFYIEEIVNGKITVKSSKQNKGVSKVYSFEELEKIVNKNGFTLQQLGDNTEEKFVFLIDEINRGEISKIFGELFYSMDPGYRGQLGTVSLQYSKESFFIPENVYIIGTMNNIDRSVDTFDFAMRRRFRFIEVTYQDTQDMLDPLLGKEAAREAKARLLSLNEKISDLFHGNDYHIGASYFIKLQDLNYKYELLWNEYLEPLMRDYLKGRYDTEADIESLKKCVLPNNES